jgi:hypothetical protein
MSPHHNEINTFFEEDTHGEHTLSLETIVRIPGCPHQAFIV